MLKIVTTCEGDIWFKSLSNFTKIYVQSIHTVFNNFQKQIFVSSFFRLKYKALLFPASIFSFFEVPALYFSCKKEETKKITSGKSGIQRWHFNNKSRPRYRRQRKTPKRPKHKRKPNKKTKKERYQRQSRNKRV